MKTFLKVLFNKFIWGMLCFADLLTFNQTLILNRLKYWLLTFCGMKIQYPFFTDTGFRCTNPRNIKIGANCSFGHYNRIWAFNEVIIGDYVQSAIGLTIIAGSHASDSYEPLNNQQVIIEGENWIGANVTILGGVTIGRGAIIGAGSVVNKNIPPYTIAAGVPAKVIKKRIPASMVLSPFGYYKPEFDEFK